jgi:hypothetical protein
MPLYPNARIEIRRNLRRIEKGKSARLIAIGRLTEEQLRAINEKREAHGLAPIVAEVVFRGRHPYQSRVLKDGYTIEDVADQICSGMDAASVVLESSGMTEMQNPNPRADAYGNHVRDRLVFECTSKHPRPEVFNVIPKGDIIKPAKK